MARETEVHYLPAEYQGRCQGQEKVDYVSSYVSFGGSLPKGEVLHKFEMRLPIPDASGCEALDTECKELFNFSASDMIDKALGKILTDVDETFKAYLFKKVIKNADGESIVVHDPAKYEPTDGDEDLFDEVSDPTDAGPSYDPDRHVFAQDQIDSWRYTPRGASKSMQVSAFVQQLVQTGRVTAEQMEGVENQADLFKRLADLGIM